MKTKLNYNETSLIVNALDYYTHFCESSENEAFKKRFKKNIYDVKEKFEKLENQILDLELEEEENEDTIING